MESKAHWVYRVLIVDDEDGIHSDFRDMLNPPTGQLLTDQLAESLLDGGGTQKASFLPNFQLLHAESGEKACQMIRDAKQSNQPIAVAYIDVRMPPGIDGVEAIRQIREIDKDIELVIMTAYTDKPLPEIIHDMELLHKLLYIRKPFAPEEIQQITIALVGKWNIEQTLAEQQKQIIINHQNLEISHQRLETVLDATADAIGMFDDKGHLLFANQDYQQLFDLTEDQLRQMSPDAINAQTQQRFQESEPVQLNQALPKNLENMLEENKEASQDEPRLFYRLITPVHNSQGDFAGNVVSYRDMSKEVEIQQMKAEVLRLRNELETTYPFGEIIGNSGKIKQTFGLMQQAAQSNITVLISGESGTGKELVARAIHANSDRKAKPFIPVNCAAIPNTLIESELFGHERGAFTGATTQRIGTFEQANQGTIFLDEIGDMELALQAKLLRVLQERKIQRVGGTVSIPIDIRVLTATNQDLADAVQAGRFRKDLFYRIAAFQITVPPLRQRQEDIPHLAAHFLKKYTETMNKSIEAISNDALRLLMQHHFPGNVRELENIIERAVLLETAEVLQPSSLPPELLPRNNAKPPDSNGILPFEEVERQTLHHALKIMDYNVGKAAQALDIDRSTLYRKVKRYKLIPSE